MDGSVLLHYVINKTTVYVLSKCLCYHQYLVALRIV